MSSRVRIIAALIFLAGALFPAVSQAQEQGAEKTDRPNILFLYSDDLHHEHFGFRENSTIKTPNIDRLASQGVVMENAFANSPICVTSRANMMTGRYAARTGLYHDEFSGLPEEHLKQIWPILLNRAGYHTGYVGKWHLKSVPDDTFDADKRFRGQGSYWTDNRKPGEGDHLTDSIGDGAADMIREAPEDRPFAITVGFKAPHVQDGFYPTESYPPPPSTATLYERAEIQAPANSDPEFFEDQPDFIRNSLGRKRWQYRLGPPKSLNFQRTMRRYFRMVTGIDKQVGKMLDALRKTGKLDETIIVLSSDHGTYLGERGLAGKWFGHEPSIRIPLVVYDPRLPESERGSTRKEMVTMLDFHPTVLDWAGLTPAEGVQGKSFAPIIEGNTPEDWRSSFFIEHHSYPKHIPPSEGVRTERYKYLRYTNSDPLYEELYDLKKDPTESNTLADDPEHKQLLKEMRKKWKTLHEQAK